MVGELEWCFFGLSADIARLLMLYQLIVLFQATLFQTEKLAQRLVKLHIGPHTRAHSWDR